MNAPPRPALAALEAGIAHVARHHPMQKVGVDSRERLVAFRVALNILKELDTLLGHAVIETAAMSGVVLRARGDTPVRRALAELVAALGPGVGSCAGLAEAEWAREGLVQALAGRRASERHRLPAAYPGAIGTTYRRIADDLARMPCGLSVPAARIAFTGRGDDARSARR